MKSGTITLYDHIEQFLDSRKYEYNHDKKRIIAHWKIIYAQKYDGCYIQYSPDVDINLIDKNGCNIQRKNAKNNHKE